MNNLRHIILAIVALLIVGGIVFIESTKVRPVAPDTTNTSSGFGGKIGDRAPEISTPDGFINVDSITIQDELAKGNIILVDYWTYSCINCQRTIPFLNEWHEKYGDKGLTIIGLHTPEFEFEKKYENVLDAVTTFGIKYPVVLDNDFSTWRAYGNLYWPRKYLVSTDGTIVYDHIGEGSYEETEKEIIALLKKTQSNRSIQKLSDMPLVSDPLSQPNQRKPQSPETYLGYQRIEYITPTPDASCADTMCTFIKPDALPLHTFSLDGKWTIERERSVLSDNAGSLFLHFAGRSVNLVAEGLQGSVTATLYLDGKPIAESGGTSVTDSKVTFMKPVLYNLVSLEKAGEEHELEIRFDAGKGFAGFAFTFGN